MHISTNPQKSPCGDVPVKPESPRIRWYCNEILKRTEGSGPISTIEFNREGTHLAYGNADGIVSLVQIGEAEESSSTGARHACSKPYQSFLSHESEFDCLKSQAIDEKISLIRWLPRSGPSHFLLSSNERTIKLWRLVELPVQAFTNMNFPTESGSRRKIVIRTPSDIKVPVCSYDNNEPVVRVYNKKVFARAHAFSITGLSPCADRQTFFSSDPLRINLWDLEVDHEVFSIVDRTLERLDDATHLITGLACTNQTPALFAYCTNRGSVRICDTRSNALCDQPALSFDSLAADEPNILTLLINSISDIKFGHASDRYLFTRDYINVKVWDTHMTSYPVEVYPVQPYLRNHLSSLYESEHIFDDFKLSLSSDDRFIITGSYDDSVKVFDRQCPGDGAYHLLMQKDDPGQFLDPYCIRNSQNMFAASSTEVAQLSWPRLLSEDLSKTPNPGGATEYTFNTLFDDFTRGNLSNTMIGRKWLQVAWRPASPVVAVSHSDGVHLLQALVE